jgi:hypothetical protein
MVASSRSVVEMIPFIAPKARHTVAQPVRAGDPNIARSKRRRRDTKLPRYCIEHKHVALNFI